MTVSLVPVPGSVHESDGAPFRLDGDVVITGDSEAAAALADLIVQRTHLRATRRDSASSSGVSTIISAGVHGSIGTDAPSDAADAPHGIQLRVTPGGAAESYRIASDAASVIVDGSDAAGLFYGVQTLGQLLGRDPDGWIIPAVEIEDAPRFAYRGVMLDVARHFFPVDVVTAYIDRAASLKLNALHLHLTDDQGWRLELRSRPELTARASGTAVDGDPGGFYTRDDYRAIVAHAASRHMIVVPEIDVPGHTHAVGLAYPDLVEAPVLSDAVREQTDHLPEAGVPYTGVAVGFSSLRIQDEATYTFLADVFGEVAGLTPGPYLHIGGDECLGTDPDDFAVFVGRATEIVSDLGKTPVAWHEAGASSALAPETIGQYWGFVTPAAGMAADARAFVRNGAQLILSPSDAVYLDMKPTADAELGLVWANGPTTVARAYDWDPATLIDGVGEADILGVEAPMWAETIRTLADIDTLAFPRIAAAAEIAWSPAPGASADRTFESFRSRVGRIGGVWTALGIRWPRSAEIVWADE